MAIPALRSGGFGSSVFQRANREAQRIGGQVTHAKMQEVASVIGGSNFGTGTKLGKGQFHQTQNRVAQDGAQSTSQVKQAEATSHPVQNIGKNVDIAA